MIYEKFRNRKYGYKSLDLLEKSLIHKEIISISLHVFTHNKVALKLYKNLNFSIIGYEVGGIRMKKIISF